jgi:serine/threonine protein kinase
MNEGTRIETANTGIETAHNWETLLQNTRQALHEGRKFIQNGTSQTGLLPISEIVNESKSVIEKLPKRHENYVQIASNIIILTESLITAREEKRAKSLLRRAAIVLCAIASLLLIGIPFLLMLRKNNKTFENNVNKLREELIIQRDIVYSANHQIKAAEENILRSIGPLATQFGGEGVNPKGGAFGIVLEVDEGENVIKFVRGRTQDEDQTYAIKELAQEFDISQELNDIDAFVQICEIEPYLSPGGIIGCLVKMPKIIGPSLGEETIEPQRRTKIIAQSADALASAVERGVFPFDVHGENVLITDEGPKFIDYGQYRKTDQAEYFIDEYFNHYCRLFDTMGDLTFKDYLTNAISDFSERYKEIPATDQEGRTALINELHRIRDYFNSITI